MWALFRLLDKERKGVISFEEFLDGCLHLRGTASSIQLAKVAQEQREMRTLVQKLCNILLAPSRSTTPRSESPPELAAILSKTSHIQSMAVVSDSALASSFI